MNQTAVIDFKQSVLISNVSVKTEKKKHLLELDRQHVVQNLTESMC